METITVKSTKNLKIGDFIEGRKIVSKPGVFHYQLPKPKRFPRRPNGSPKMIKVTMGTKTVRDPPGFIAATRPMVNFNIFSGR